MIGKNEKSGPAQAGVHTSEDVNALVADGNKFMELGDEEKANELFSQAVSICSTSWDAWFGYAATGGDRSGRLSFVSAYSTAYYTATEEHQELATFSALMRFLQDGSLSEVLIEAYKAASLKHRHEMFDLVLGVVGRGESEIARLVIDLCTNDWRAWFAQAKITQVRVRWSGKKPEKEAFDVLNLFLHAYQLASGESSEARETVLAHISDMEKDLMYSDFAHELLARIEQEPQ